jgi:YVTN family beta-propeller protein
MDDRSARGLRFTRGIAVAVAACVVVAAPHVLADKPRLDVAAVKGELLPTGFRITPGAAPGSHFGPLLTDLPGVGHFKAGQAVTTVTSPDGQTLLVLTSGYNRNNGPDGKSLPDASNEYVFVYDFARGEPVQRQVLQVPNTFNGIAFHPDGSKFYVSGGVDDSLHVFTREGTQFTESAPAIALGHNGVGLGLEVQPAAAGVAVNRTGTRAIVANFENDSVSVIDLASRAVVAEVDLRPGKQNPVDVGKPGGSYPYWVAIRGDDTAYVSSQRDHEIVVVDLAAAQPHVTGRIAVGNQPTRMLLDRAQKRLFVACATSDSVQVIDLERRQVIDEIVTSAPPVMSWDSSDLHGANPNSLALSPDERFLYVTNGGMNSLAVVRLAERSRVVGLIPTGWYPNSVSVSNDGTRLVVVNGKSVPGPNGGACRDKSTTAADANAQCSARNLYTWQLHKAGLLSFPVPSAAQLAGLTWQVGQNNRFPGVAEYDAHERMMAFLRSRIDHVIYIVKENRTYDQVLGDLEVGDGDPSLTLFPEPITPNHHSLAGRFVTLDAFFDSGEVSGDGWNWSVAGRTTDFTEKTVSVNYAGRGLVYDWEGTNRNINVALPTLDARHAANPVTPADPDLLAGTNDVAAPDGPGGEVGTGYLWDAALRKGLEVRNYGFYGDGAQYAIEEGQPGHVPLVRDPYAQGIVQFFPANPSLLDVSDPYFRGYDQRNADYWLYREWEREFDGYVKGGKLPALSFVRFPHDHFGEFANAIDGVNTPDTQMADNDYAIGLLVDKVAKSPFGKNTLVFIVEDDAQNGGDHVDAHRSLAYVVGPYVKRRALVTTPYTTVHMVRTIVDVLGLEPFNTQVAFTPPMGEVFSSAPEFAKFRYDAIVPEVLRTTQLPLPAAPATVSAQAAPARTRPAHDAAYWQAALGDQDFSREDKLDEADFNRKLWHGIMGDDVAYPVMRHGKNLRGQREKLIAESRARRESSRTVTATR